MPKISVVLCVKRQKYLKEAVLSVLNQSYQNFELIIVNDSGKKLILPKDKGIILINNRKNLGLTKSLNIGCQKAKGEYIARMDADDIAKPDRFITQLDFMSKNPKIAVVGSWVDLIDENNKFLRIKKLPSDYQKIKNNLIKANQFYHPTLFIRKKVFEKLGYYDEKYKYSQDYELILRVASKFPVANIPQSLLFYRVNTKGAISYDYLKQQAKYALFARLKAIKEYNYPKWQLIYLVKPLISFIMPKFLIILIYKTFFFNNEQ